MHGSNKHACNLANIHTTKRPPRAQQIPYVFTGKTKPVLPMLVYISNRTIATACCTHSYRFHEVWQLAGPSSLILAPPQGQCVHAAVCIQYASRLYYMASFWLPSLSSCSDAQATCVPLATPHARTHANPTSHSQRRSVAKCAKEAASRTPAQKNLPALDISRAGRPFSSTRAPARMCMGADPRRAQEQGEGGKTYNGLGHDLLEFGRHFDGVVAAVAARRVGLFLLPCFCLPTLKHSYKRGNPRRI